MRRKRTSRPSVVGNTISALWRATPQALIGEERQGMIDSA
jgi:hypothetical protein